MGQYITETVDNPCLCCYAFNDCNSLFTVRLNKCFELDGGIITEEEGSLRLCTSRVTKWYLLLSASLLALISHSSCPPSNFTRSSDSSSECCRLVCLSSHSCNTQFQNRQEGQLSLSLTFSICCFQLIISLLCRCLRSAI